MTSRSIKENRLSRRSFRSVQSREWRHTRQSGSHILFAGTTLLECNRHYDDGGTPRLAVLSRASAGTPGHLLSRAGDLAGHPAQANRPKFTRRSQQRFPKQGIDRHPGIARLDRHIRAPVRRVRKPGSLQHWRVTNPSREVHPFHIHQVHFLVYAADNKPVKDPVWVDTVNVSYGSSVDLVMDFTDPIIRGMSLFHCHLLSHEDKGMMAKILFR
jgi:FtsP/CotA-like multicopper oxidase with cupredoxin domain